MVELSVLIPARNEEFLQQTIDDVLRNSGEQTEVIAVLDGYIPKPELKSTDPRVTIIYNPEAKGQRVASNQAAKLAKGKYVMKIDAHCAFDKDFDVKMLQAFKEVGDNVTMVPVMRNLHAFDWVCPNGHRRYQSPSGVCKECGQPTTKDIVWIPKTSPQAFSYRFDKTMHFQYWDRHGDSQKGDLTETMSLQGSCFMCTKEKYFELGLCGEEFHSWGQQGVEVACKTWLSGGRVLVNRRTWYAHMFRTQGGDFGFPYHQDSHLVNQNRELSRKMFQHDGWPKAIHKFQWLLDKFQPPDWVMTKGICYYSDNTCDGTKLGEEVKNRLKKISQDKNIPITTACLKKIDLGIKNVCFPSLKRGILTMFKQILASLENCREDIVYLCEADVLYDPSHFDFTPPSKDIYYYNQNNWQLRVDDGFAVYFDCKRVSQCCAYRDLLIEHYRKRIKMVEEHGFSRAMGYEPGSHNRPERVDDVKSDIFISKVPNIDLAHGTNVTARHWSPKEFRSQRNCQNWKEGYEIPYWGKTSDIISLLK
jgi:glycosyltransferase involved in cell wall biosynthesis